MKRVRCMALLFALPLSGCAGTHAQPLAPRPNGLESSDAPSAQAVETLSFPDGPGPISGPSGKTDFTCGRTPWPLPQKTLERFLNGEEELS